MSQTSGSPPRISRITSIGNLETHRTTYFDVAIKAMFKGIFDNRMSPPGAQRIADPFARNCQIGGKYTNDIDENTEARFNLDAKDFLCSMESGVFDGVIFDPPFSQRQAERYEAGHSNVYTEPGYVRDCMYEIERMLKPGGYLLKFGFNSTRHRQSFELQRMWSVNFGGNHNDTIVTLWRKEQHHLGEWS